MKIFWAGFIAPLALVAADAPRSAFLGTWDATATDSRGVRTRWILAVKLDSGGHSAQLRSEDGFSLAAIEPRRDGDRFRFKLRIGQTELVEVNLKQDGDRLTGDFRGNDAGSGSFAASRIQTRDISGVWTGTWDVDPDGKPSGPHHMVLRLAGDRVTGTAGPWAEQQAPIADGALPRRPPDIRYRHPERPPVSLRLHGRR